MGGQVSSVLLRLQPLTSPLMPGDHTLMLFSPAFDSAVMFKDLHFNTTSMKQGNVSATLLSRRASRPLLIRIESHTHTHTNRHKQMHRRRENNAKLLGNRHMSNKGGMKPRGMLGDAEGWTFSGTQEYSLSLRKSTKHQTVSQILFPKALQWILPSNRVGFTDFLRINFHLHRNFHVGNHNMNSHCALFHRLGFPMMLMTCTIAMCYLLATHIGLRWNT